MIKIKPCFSLLTSLSRIIPGFILTFLILSFFPAVSISAEMPVSGAGSTSTNFQKIGMSARAAAMGDAFTAVSDDASAVYWNPAGLPLARGTQFSITHAEWMQGVTDEYFSFSHNLDNGSAFGAGIEYLGTGPFAGALETPNGDYGGAGPDISATNYAGSLAFGQRLANWFDLSGWGFMKNSYIGVKATVVGQNVINMGAGGLAFDAGYMNEIIRKTFNVSAVIYNFGTRILDFSQPTIYKFGASYRLRNAFMKRDQNLFALELNGHIDTGLKVNFGDEYKLGFGRNSVALRLGYRTGGDLGTLAGLTSGIGLSHRFDDFTAGLDYAFVPYGILGETHRVSLNIMLGGKLGIPEAFLGVPPAFVLGQQALDVTFAAKSDEPIDQWKMDIVDASGVLTKTQKGDGNPPSHFLWDGRNQAGALVPQGNYTFKLEVTDSEGQTGQAMPRESFARWVPKKVPYQYSFMVPGDMLFDSGMDQLLPKGKEAIEKAVRAIQQRYPDSLIIIAGHTDNQRLVKGARFADNQELSVARAKAVVNYLVQTGIDPAKLTAMGYGESKPIAANTTKEGMAKNRRVELIVSGVMDATAEDLIEEGKIMFKMNRFREALDRFLTALKSDIRNAKAFHYAGDCYMRLGAKDQAITAYRESLKWNPQDTALRDWLNQFAPETKPEAPPAAPAGSSTSPQGGSSPLPQASTAPSGDQTQAPATTNNPPPVPSGAAPQAGSSASPQAAPANPNTGVPLPVEANP
jgi:outer membrane protein OmpA-like peptidoglycan-associated protein